MHRSFIRFMFSCCQEVVPMGSSVAAGKGADAAGLQATVAVCGSEGDSVASRVMDRLAQEAPRHG